MYGPWWFERNDHHFARLNRDVVGQGSVDQFHLRFVDPLQPVEEEQVMPVGEFFSMIDKQYGIVRQ